MLQYFRINDPYRLLGLLVLMTLLLLAFFIDAPSITILELKGFLLGEKIADGFTPYSEIIDSTPPGAAWFYGLTSWIFGRSIFMHHLFGFLVLFCQGAFLGIILIDKKAFPDNTFIPSFLFSLLTLISFDFFSLSADLVSFGFSLLALNNVFKEVEFKIQRDETMLNLGLYVGIATLFNFSFLIYLPGVILILVIFTRSTFQKYLLLIVGFSLPHATIVTSYFLFDETTNLWNYYYSTGFSFEITPLLNFTSLMWLIGVPVLYILISLFILNRDARLTKYQSQLSQVMFMWFLVSLAQVFLTNSFRPQSLIVLLPSASFFLTHFFLLIRRRKFIELNAWVLLIGLTIVFYSSRYGYIKQVNYSQLLVPNTVSTLSEKSVLNLGNDFSIYRSNTLAPPFTDAKLAKEIFENPDYYENVLLVNSLFEKDKPEVIIDPNDLIRAYFYRIPTLANEYEKNQDGYVLKTSN